MEALWIHYGNHDQGQKALWKPLWMHGKHYGSLRKHYGNHYGNHYASLIKAKSTRETTIHAKKKHYGDMIQGKKKQKNYSTQYSRVVSHHSTDCGITSLTLEIKLSDWIPGTDGLGWKYRQMTCFYRNNNHDYEKGLSISLSIVKKDSDQSFHSQKGL